MNKIRYAFDLIVLQGRNTLLRVIMVGTSFCLAFAAILLMEGISIGEKSCNKVLVNGINGFANLIVNGDFQQVKVFLERMTQLEGIDSVGNMVDYGSNYQNKDVIKDIQYGHAREYALTLNNQLEIKAISPTLLNLCNFRLMAGEKWEELEKEEDVIYIYLGSAFDCVPVGTRFFQPIGKDLVVAGIFQEGMKWISCDIERISHMSALATLDYVEDLTYSVFVVSNELYSNQFVLSVTEEYSIEQILQVVNECAKNYELSVSEEKLSDVFEKGYRESHHLTKGMISLAFICLFAVTLISVSFQLIEMIEHAKDAGILISVGFSPKDVADSFLLKDILLTVSSLIISILVSLVFADGFFYSDGVSTVINKMYFRYIIPFGILLSAIEIVSSAVAIRMFMRTHTPTQLMRIL